MVDIPEVFRRAFEEQDEWGEGDEGSGGKGDGRPGRSWWKNRWIWLAAITLILILSFNWIITTYTDWLWFSTLDFQSVWLTQWLVQVAIFLIALLIAGAVVLINWRIGLSNGRQSRSLFGPPILDLPQISWLVNGLGVLIAVVFASAASAQWEQILLFFYRQPFNIDDPIFNIDIGFYMFELPVYGFIKGWSMSLLVITLLGVAGLYLVENRPNLEQRQWQLVFSPSMRRHVAFLATLIFLFWAAGYWLDTYQLLYSPRGVVFGASFTDLKASLPALYVQMGLMLLLALVTAVNIFRSALRPLLIVGGIWLVATIALAMVYPTVLQRYSVEPNELSKERPYIKNNIELTRIAFGLDEVDTRAFGNVTELTNQDLVQNTETLKNVRLWDYRPLQQTYAQLQELRPYYEFSSIDIDRYEIDGEVRQVMLAGRELNKQNLPGQSWVNQKLEFTHGYGVVMNPVDKVTPQGRPEFYIKDLPPKSTISLDVDQPAIYYGELMNDVVFAGSGLDEFDYPVGEANAYSSYEGDGGVTLNNILKKVAFAIRFGETNLLLSDYIDDETRILMNRQIRDRVRKITPFLALDNDPYLIVADGQLVWMLDAYTISNNFPYSTPTEEGFNYIRNAVKITVDAYNGSVNYYLADPSDPIAQAYSRVFPNLFQPLDSMPETLLAHIRYPEDLFVVQTRQFLKYHMNDIQVFYNQEDLWEIPLEVFDGNQQPIEPYYVILSLPDEEGVEFLLIQPYTPAGKDNMIAWIAARNDWPNYGQLVAYELPKQELVFGPAQVEARIDQDPEISAQLSLWNQRGSRVIRGNLIVIPMGSSFLYVEPIYLLAEASELPELKRVIVASGDRIAMRETLSEALLALVLDQSSAVVVEEEGTEAEVSDESTSTQSQSEAPPSTIVDPDLEALINSANARFEAAEKAQREGDWAAYGRELEALQETLQNLMELIEK
ncbi:MAG: UPF0182 family protein [Anaerolineae bacterium]|nr:MAG: UPF0182 family protein [Anaerolineae bacterium]